MATTTPSLTPLHTPISHPKTWGGESPLYRAIDNTLHWLDPLSVPPELHILSLSSSSFQGAERVLKLEKSVSVIRFFKGQEMAGKYICGYLKGVGILDENTGELEVVKEVCDGVERRVNDGCIDAQGSFWFGEIDLKAMPYSIKGPPASHGPSIGRLWRYDPDGSVHEMDSGITLSNGMGWSPDNRTMYFNDSLVQTTYAYDYSSKNRTISNRRVFASFKGTEGEPDGLVVDAQGNIWIAVYGSQDPHRLMIFDPSGVKKYQIPINAKAITCPIFGGKDLDEVFVTSARGKDFVEGSDGGKLFQFKIPKEWEIKGTVSEGFGEKL